MKRNEFLTQHWQPYPQARGEILDVAEFLRAAATEGRVGGRLSGAVGAWHLESAGVKVPFVFISDLNWNSDCVRDNQDVTFDETVLRENDLVVLKLELKGSSCRATSVSLVFAADNPQWKQKSSESIAAKPFAQARAEEWSKFVSSVRKFFVDQGYLEARTPTLVPSPGTEPFLDPFRTQLAYGAKKSEVFLPTSPEFHLKKLLTMGFTRIFEFKDCFRNHEGGSHHQPEFLMLEWYRAYAPLSRIADETESLLREVAKVFGKNSINLKRKTIAELFQEKLAFTLTPQTSREDLLSLAKREKIEVSSDDTWDDIYFRIFLEKIEPFFETGGPWLIQNYPPSQAALARLTDDGWADRFEIYWNGLEIANAFHELNDPVANEARFEKDRADRARLGKAPVPRDSELVASLYRGMPPSGGIALGMDRLFMAVLGLKTIEETRAFAVRI